MCRFNLISWVTHSEIKAVAAELNLAEHKVKKLLITGRVLRYEQTQQIQELIIAGHTMNEVASIMSLSILCFIDLD